MYKDKSLNKNLQVENYYMSRNGPLYMANGTVLQWWTFTEQAGACTIKHKCRESTCKRAESNSWHFPQQRCV